MRVFFVFCLLLTLIPLGLWAETGVPASVDVDIFQVSPGKAPASGGDAQPEAVVGTTVAVRSEHGGEEARLILTWNQGVNFTKRIEGRELVLVFEKPFVPQGMEEATQELFAWLGDVRYGYDSLLLRANQAGTGFFVTATGNDVVVTMTLPPPTPELLEQRKVEDARLRFLKTKTMVSTRTLYGARERMRGLVEESPENVEFLGELGTLEDQLGRWRSAVALYDRGLTQAIGEPNIIFAKALLHHNQGPYLQTSASYKHSPKNNEIQLGQDVELLLVGSQGLNLNLDLRRVDLEIDNVTNAEGITANQVVEWLSGAAELAMSWADGDISRVGILAGEDHLGVTVGHDFFHPTASTRFLADWHRPYGATTNSLVDGGWRDRLEFQRDDAWHGDRLRTSLTGAVNRYGVSDDENATESLALLGSLRHAFLSRNNLELSYNLDKEMVFHEAQRLNTDGVTYTLLPMPDKETHLASAAWFDLWNDYLTYSSVLGYSYDRLTYQHGPSLAASLIYEPMADVKSALSLQRGYSRQAGEWVVTDQVDYSLKLLF
ncbi:MAG: hypothetical protein H7829_05835 [Magnetococcus sp. THC-1_WYH]